MNVLALKPASFSDMERNRVDGLLWRLLMAFYKSLSAFALAASLWAMPSANAQTITIGLQAAGAPGNSGDVGGAICLNPTGVICVVATDGGSGSTSFTGAFGAFATNNITATGAVILGNTELSTGDISSTRTTGSINIFVTEQGLSSVYTLNDLYSAFTANSLTNGKVTIVETTFVSLSNQLFTGSAIGSQTFAKTADLGTVQSVDYSQLLNGDFSVTEEYAVTVTGTGEIKSENTSMDFQSIPEPTSLALIGAGLIGLGKMRRKRA